MYTKISAYSGTTYVVPPTLIQKHTKSKEPNLTLVNLTWPVSRWQLHKASHSSSETNKKEKTTKERGESFPANEHYTSEYTSVCKWIINTTHVDVCVVLVHSILYKNTIFMHSEEEATKLTAPSFGPLLLKCRMTCLKDSTAPLHPAVAGHPRNNRLTCSTRDPVSKYRFFIRPTNEHDKCNSNGGRSGSE